MFRVPFAHVTDPAMFSVQFRRWRGQTTALFHGALRTLLHLGGDGAYAARAGRSHVGVNRITANWLTADAPQAVLGAVTGAGHLAYVVGGCVRNALLDAPVADVDIANVRDPAGGDGAGP